MRRAPLLVLVGAVGVLLGCGVDDDPGAPGSPGTTPAESPPDEQPSDEVAAPEPAEATAEPEDVATGLTTPWGLAFLPGGAVILTSRDPAEVHLVTRDGTLTLDGPGADEIAASTVTQGEGGLLGVAVSPQFDADRLVFLYRTTADGNEVVRAELDGTSLGDLETVVDGIPAAGNHNGGRIAFGPEEMLYVATGDAGTPSSAQDPQSLAGKILRVTPDGDPAPGNPTEGSPVWTLGHRNVQGLGWDAQERMFASEFGANDADELNLIQPGNNYGWPEVEGMGTVDGMINPVVVWDPAEASPSGLAVTDDAVYVAALRGERLWRVTFGEDDPAEDDPAEDEPFLVSELGRLREVAVGPDGALWILTNNTDGRGAPRDGDDRLVRMLPP